MPPATTVRASWLPPLAMLPNAWIMPTTVPIMPRIGARLAMVASVVRLRSSQVDDVAAVVFHGGHDALFDFFGLLADALQEDELAQADGQRLGHGAAGLRRRGRCASSISSCFDAGRRACSSSASESTSALWSVASRSR